MALGTPRLAVALICLLSPLVTVTAAASPTKDDAPTLVIILDARAPSGPAQALRSGLKAQLADVPVRLRYALYEERALREAVAWVREAAGGPRSLGAFWVELSEAGAGVGLHYVAPTGGRMLSRWIPAADSAQRELSIDEATLVIRSSALSLLQRPDFLEQLAPPTLPKPEVPIDALAPRASSHLALKAAYSGAMFASGAAWLSGARLGLESELPPGFVRVGGALSLLPALELKASSAAAVVSRAPMELYAAVVAPGSPRAGLELGAVADPIHRRTLLVAGGAVSRDATTRLVWSVAARARLEVALAPRTSLFVAAGAEVLVNRFDFVVEGAQAGDEPELVLSLWPVRGALQVGLSVGLL